MSTQTPWPTPLPYPYQDERQTPSAWRQVRGDVVACLTLAGAAVVLAAAVGALWRWVAPNVLAVMSQGDAYLQAPETKTFVARDGWFAVFGCAAAVLLALAGYFRYRREGAVGAVVGLAGGGIGGAYLATWVGAQIGPGHGEHIAAMVHGLKDGTVFAVPLTVRALGVLWLWPAVAVGLFFILLLLFGPNDPAPQPGPQGYPPQFQPFQGPERQGAQAGVPAWTGLNAVNGTSGQMQPQPQPQPYPVDGAPLFQPPPPSAQAPQAPQPSGPDLPPLPSPSEEPSRTQPPIQPQTPPDEPPTTPSGS
ncbi:MAG: hypothetical protein ACRDVE_12440 [Actinocrinis sp.]